jgi:hypothetical protein
MTVNDQFLAVDGQQVDPTKMTNYALRFDGAGLTLYREGRRVVKPWRLILDVEMPADPYGGNANTQ